MTQSWPTFDEAHNWAEEEEAFEKVMDYIKAVRTMRTEMNVHPAKKTSMIIETADPALPERRGLSGKVRLLPPMTFTEKYEGSTDGMVQVFHPAARGFIPMMELIDREKELARLNKRKGQGEKKNWPCARTKLNNPKFVERAPAALVEDIRAKARQESGQAGQHRAEHQGAGLMTEQKKRIFAVAAGRAGDLYLCAHRLHHLSSSPTPCRWPSRKGPAAGCWSGCSRFCGCWG